jgi:hypothetical protein
MPETRHVTRTDGVFLLVGTTKGLFVFAADAARARWELGGPYFPGQEIYAAALDTRAGRRRLIAAATSSHWGPGLAWSDDFGRTFTEPERAPIRFPEECGQALKRVWQIVPGPEDDDTLYAGVEPAALFVSRDRGETWTLNRGLFDHPHRPKWQPGGGGLCLHTILTHGGRIYCAISTAGVYRSDDGGASWQARNVGIRAPFMPPGQQYPEFGQCVHKVAGAAAQDGRLYLQHHWGVYRSDDGGDSWRDIGATLPSDFGFPIVAHPRDADALYVLPLESDAFRAVPGARLRVYQSRDGGATFTALEEGLPQENAYEAVLRDGMGADTATPMGLYFGTRSGKLFASANEGQSFDQIAAGLPPIVCVKAATC